MSRWMTIPNFPLYLINQNGEVKQQRDGRLLKMSRNNKGYFYHMTHKNGRVVPMPKEELLQWVFPRRNA